MNKEYWGCLKLSTPLGDAEPRYLSPWLDSIHLWQQQLGMKMVSEEVTLTEEN